jgi:hypothetical protein
LQPKQLLGFLLTAVLAVTTVSSAGAAQPQSPVVTFDLLPGGNAVANALPNARGTVTVIKQEETRGLDQLVITVEGFTGPLVPPGTSLTVFLVPSGGTQAASTVSGVPFVSGGVNVPASYLADIPINEAGRGSVSVSVIVDESVIVTATAPSATNPVQLNAIGLWFSEPDTVVPGTTAFDGDGQAGVRALGSIGDPLQ